MIFDGNNEYTPPPNPQMNSCHHSIPWHIETAATAAGAWDESASWALGKFLSFFFFYALLTNFFMIRLDVHEQWQRRQTHHHQGRTREGITKVAGAQDMTHLEPLLGMFFFLFSDFLSKILLYLVLPRWQQMSTPPQWCIKLAAAATAVVAVVVATATAGGAVGAWDSDASWVPSKFIFFFFFGSTNLFFFSFRLHVHEFHHSHHINTSNNPSNSCRHHRRSS